MTYFRTGSPYYHRRAAVSRSCSGWEGVVPAGYGRQALRLSGIGYQGSVTEQRDVRCSLISDTGLIPGTEKVRLDRVALAQQVQGTQH